jgi:hypothetical protein
MFVDNNALVEKFIKLACSGIHGSIIRDNEIVIKCNICGDGKKKSSKRGHFKYNNKTSKPFWYYKCFNGDCVAYNKSFPAQWWLQQYHPSLYRSYQREALHSNKSSDIDIIKSTTKQIDTISKKTKETKDKDLFKHFYPISSDKHSLCSIARSFCDNRRIPRSSSNKFYVCSDGQYKERLIIPFFNAKNKIIYFQGRSLTGREPKYLNQKDVEKVLYNIDHIDKNKPICALEGAIDSMFIENSIAFSGLSISENLSNYLNKLQIFYILDDDKAGRILTLEYLSNGKHVFLWNKFKKDYPVLQSSNDKLDINDAFIKLGRTELFKFEELKKYFSNSWFDKIYV